MSFEDLAPCWQSAVGNDERQSAIKKTKNTTDLIIFAQTEEDIVVISSRRRNSIDVSPAEPTESTTSARLWGINPLPILLSEFDDLLHQKMDFPANTERQSVKFLSGFL